MVLEFLSWKDALHVSAFVALFKNKNKHFISLLKMATKSEIVWSILIENTSLKYYIQIHLRTFSLQYIYIYIYIYMERKWKKTQPLL